MESKIEKCIAVFRQQNQDYVYCVLRRDGKVWLKVYLDKHCVDAVVMTPS
jgi:hypothetical protein